MADFPPPDRLRLRSRKRKSFRKTWPDLPSRGVFSTLGTHRVGEVVPGPVARQTSQPAGHMQEKYRQLQEELNFKEMHAKQAWHGPEPWMGGLTGKTKGVASSPF